MKRLLVSLACLVGMLGIVGAATPAYAYPPGTPSGEVSAATVGAGGEVIFSGNTTPHETLTISVEYKSSTSTNYFWLPRKAATVLGTVTTDENGDWQFVVKLTQAGVAVLTASGPSGSVTLEVTVQGSSGLAVTGIAGGKVPVMLLGGVGAVLLGALLVFAAVRWRRRVAGVDIA